MHGVHGEASGNGIYIFNLPFGGTVEVNNEWALRTGIKRAFCGGKHGKKIWKRVENRLSTC